MSTRTIKHGDLTYKLVVMQILEKDDFGRPSKVTVGYDDTAFSLRDSEEFMTAFVPVDMMQIETKGDA